jgi:hypothetical protein
MPQASTSNQSRNPSARCTSNTVHSSSPIASGRLVHPSPCSAAKRRANPECRRKAARVAGVDGSVRRWEKVCGELQSQWQRHGGAAWQRGVARAATSAAAPPPARRAAGSSQLSWSSCPTPPCAPLTSTNAIVPRTSGSPSTSSMTLRASASVSGSSSTSGGGGGAGAGDGAGAVTPVLRLAERLRPPSGSGGRVRSLRSLNMAGRKWETGNR